MKKIRKKIKDIFEITNGLRIKVKEKQAGIGASRGEVLSAGKF
jgi:hypothetical protein